MQSSCKSKILLLTITLSLMCLVVGYPKALAAPGGGDGTFDDGALVRRKGGADGSASAGQDNPNLLPNLSGTNPGAPNAQNPGGGQPGQRRRFRQQQGQGAADMNDKPGGGFGGRRNGPGGGPDGSLGGGPGGRHLRGGPGGPDGGSDGSLGGGPGGRHFGGGQGGPDGGPGGRHFGGGLGGYSAPGFGRGQKLDFSSLNLSEDQKQRIRQLHEANGAKQKDLRKDLASRSQAFKDMMFDPSASDDQIRAKRKELWRMRGQMEESQIEDFLGIRAMLTPDQRQKLTELKPGRQVAGNNVPPPGGPPDDATAPGAGAPGQGPGRPFGGGSGGNLGMRKRDFSNPNTTAQPDN